MATVYLDSPEGRKVLYVRVNGDIVRFVSAYNIEEGWAEVSKPKVLPRPLWEDASKVQEMLSNLDQESEDDEFGETEWETTRLIGKVEVETLNDND